LFGYYLTYQNCINVEKEKVKSLVTDISHQIRTPLASIKIYNSLLKMCTTLVDKNPSIGAFLFECTGMQPFARGVQAQIDLPVFSWGTLLEYAYSVVNHRDYYGHV
jgi:hypothetical protein